MLSSLALLLALVGAEGAPSPVAAGVLFVVLSVMSPPPDSRLALLFVGFLIPLPVETVNVSLACAPMSSSRRFWFCFVGVSTPSVRVFFVPTAVFFAMMGILHSGEEERG